MQCLGVSQKIKLSNNNTQTHTLLLEYIHTLKSFCLGLQTKFSSQKRKHYILCWKVLHSLHGNVHNVSGHTWAGNSQGNTLSVNQLCLYYRWKCWKLQNLVNAYALHCYSFLIAEDLLNFECCTIISCLHGYLFLIADSVLIFEWTLSSVVCMLSLDLSDINSSEV